MSTIKTEVLIVGGGPAGSACARRLRQAGVDCLILDRYAFPRFKTCAGWVTPELIRDLEMDPAEYPHSFTTFHSFKISFRGLNFTLRTKQHAIRRIEFDNWLLRRSGAPVKQHAVKQIEHNGDGYLVDDTYFGKYLVGAGGTHCPVYRTFFQPAHPSARGTLIVAQEEEFAFPFKDDRCYLWFLENKLPGYAWYVPKANGYVNIGLGGAAKALKRNGDTLKNQWNYLIQKLDALGLVQGHAFKPEGHAYYLRQRSSEARIDNAYIVGDAASLATYDMGEGIHPAIQSGIMAAEAILNGSDYSLRSIPKYSWPSLLRLTKWRKN